MSVMRYWRTARYLRPGQVYNRLWFRMYRPRPDTSAAPARARLARPFIEPHRRTSGMVAPARFCFLNETREIASSADWNNPAWPKLWLYHLHYFDDLNAVGAEQRRSWHTELMVRWLAQNLPGEGVGWEPYPCALRIVNWIKWALRGNTLPQSLEHSLAVQARWLSRRLEYHLLGNHLFANAKALIYAGSFFVGAEARRWQSKGCAILQEQLPQQLLSDGAHVERSPMYHAIILEDLLDLVNLSGVYDIQQLPGRLESDIAAMRVWLQAMTHPDGGLGFFNDATLDVAGSLKQLEAYANRLGLAAPAFSIPDVLYFRDSGYVRADRGPAVLLADIGSVGPSYLPAHAHAGTLSFELSLCERRVLVNSGTSVYASGHERERQRGTAAHNTVTVDEQNSSEVWNSFRVGARAKVFDVSVDDGDPASIRAAHDGYCRLAGRPVHRREWRMNQKSLVVSDVVEGSGAPVLEWHYHLHPTIEVRQRGPQLFDLNSNDRHVLATLVIDGADECRQEMYSYHPGFGVSQDAIAIRVRRRGPLPVRVRTTLTW